MRPRGTGGSYYNRGEKRSSQAKSRLGRGVYNRHSEENEDDDQDDVVDDNAQNRGQGPGVKFFLSSNQGSARGQDRYPNRFNGDSGSESGGYDGRGSAEDQRHRTRVQPTSGLAFTSDLGDSFVSEIGGSSGHAGSGSRRERGRDQGQDDMADSLEDERESQKKGVFGLLNQIYELNNVTK